MGSVLNLDFHAEVADFLDFSDFVMLRLKQVFCTWPHTVFVGLHKEQTNQLQKQNWYLPQKFLHEHTWIWLVGPIVSLLMSSLHISCFLQSLTHSRYTVNSNSLIEWILYTKNFGGPDKRVVISHHVIVYCMSYAGAQGVPLGIPVWVLYTTDFSSQAQEIVFTNTSFF